MYRGTPLEGEPLGLDAVPALPVNPSAEFPKTCTETQVYIPREMPHVYSECADIWNPVHTERVEALAAGLPDIILHGTATWALAGKEIVNTYADGDGNALQRLTGRFVGMVIPGSTITIRHAPDPDEPTAIRYEVLTEDGNLAMDQGVALIDP